MAQNLSVVKAVEDPKGPQILICRGMIFSVPQDADILYLQNRDRSGLNAT
jgi:hypothetical protein